MDETASTLPGDVTHDASPVPSPGFELVGLDHVQLAMPPGGEDIARQFYGQILGLREVPKPSPLASRGGCWFEGDAVRLHLGVEAEFVPARKAHPGLIVVGLDALVARLAQELGTAVRWSDEIPGTRRCHVHDPFGNRIELIDGATP